MIKTKPDPSEISRLRSGDADAFEQIIRAHNQRLFRIARAILRDPFEAEDTVQEAYMKVFGDLDAFAGIADQGAWLARVTTNLALSRLRQKKRNAHLIESLKTNSNGDRKHEKIPDRACAHSQPGPRR